jgi:hypothetical protein
MEATMARVRSPNYPSIPLGAALEAVRPAFKKENRNKMSRRVLAGHMGYTSLNGRSLGRIGAVRSYGLVEGSGDELKISDDAVHALVAPVESIERQDALNRMARRPSLFRELREEFPDDLPSEENLHYSLVKRGFTETAAGKAAKSFLASMRLATGLPDDYNPADYEDSGEEDEVEYQSPPRRPPPSVNNPGGQQRTIIMAGERELTRGLLSRDANFRLIVNGKIGVKEIERLIKKLEFDKEILADQDEDEDRPSANQMLE